MGAEFSIRNGQDIRELSEAEHSAWAGAGADTLGLTGQVNPADFEALSDLVSDDEDQADEVGSYEAQPTSGVSLIEQMRSDGTL